MSLVIKQINIFARLSIPYPGIINIIIKRLIFIPLSVVLCFAGIQAAPNKDSVTLKYNQTPLQEVLNSITTQTGIRFSYNPQLIDTEKKISVNIRNKSIDETLSSLLPSAITYKKIGKHIVLSSPKATEPEVKNTASPTSAPATITRENKEKDTDLKKNNKDKYLIPSEELILSKKN